MNVASGGPVTLPAVLKDYGGPLEICSVVRPVPATGQILIELEASGVCHTDVHVWKGGLRPPTNPSPFVLGHEGVGRMIAVDLDPAKLKLAMGLGAEVSEQPNSAHVCINFAPTPTTWEKMVALIRPRGRIISAALVPEPVDLNQEWLTGSGVSITGTSVGTRAQLAELMALHASVPLHSEVTRIRLKNVTVALEALEQGRAQGRYCIVF